MEKEKNFTNPEYYENRELSWLKFNSRVLYEAKDKTIPLLERLKFVGITSSNLDEFFMVRVASLKDMVHAGYKKKDIAGMTAAEQLEAINLATRELVESQYFTYNRSMLPLLKEQNIEIIHAYETLNETQAAFADNYFQDSVYPVLTPMAVDASKPFPLIRNKTLNIGALIKRRGDDKEIEFATVQVPSVLPRFVEIPSAKEGSRTFLLLEQMIERNISKLFLNFKVVCAFPYRIMRNADLPIDEDEAADLLKEIQKQLKKRQWGEVIRLEVEAGIDEALLSILKEQLRVKDEDIYHINGPLDLTFVMKLYDLEDCDMLRYKKFRPQKVQEIDPETDIFDSIRKGDILMHHPYQTFDPVVEFIRQASVDPDVLAIKQTLYRVSGNSPIIASLAQAAENGKQVTVLVELKARFDEEHNIVWAKKLEQAGCHVIYGLVGLKTHSKITLVVRREEEGIRRYVHLGTGNYNDATAKLYTDVGLFTCSPSIGEDATAVFNMLSGYSEPLSWNKLSLAPLWLKDRFLFLINREKEHALVGRGGHMIAKVNSLCDKEVIKALYEAAAAGVKIELIIRGICCLKTGLPGIGDNITVRSIVGNFLEHGRIFYFENNGKPEYYCASADWMPRNLERRVEIMFPVDLPELQKKLMAILDRQLRDNVKAHVLMPEGIYVKETGEGEETVNSQLAFCRMAVDNARKQAQLVNNRVFIPEKHHE